MSFPGFLPLDLLPIALCGRSPSTRYHKYLIAFSFIATVNFLQVNVTLSSAVIFGLAGVTVIAVMKVLSTYTNDDG